MSLLESIKKFKNKIPVRVSTFSGSRSQFNLNWSSDTNSGEAEWASVGGKIKDEFHVCKGIITGLTMSGVIDGKIGFLQGSTMISGLHMRKRFPNALSFPKTADVKVEATCEKGAARLSMRTPEGKIISVDLSDGEQKTLHGISEIYLFVLRLKVESLTEEISNFHYTISFQLLS